MPLIAPTPLRVIVPLPLKPSLIARAPISFVPPITPLIVILPVSDFRVKLLLVAELESIFPLKSIVPSLAVVSKVVSPVKNTFPLMSISFPVASTAVTNSPPI